jgi:iron complex transport system permease protein
VLYISMFVGRFGVAPAGVLQILGSRVLPFVSASADASTTVVLDVRLPRVLLAAPASVSGAAFQDMFRNALVSPDILGVSAAAGFGAALSTGSMCGFSAQSIPQPEHSFGPAYQCCNPHRVRSRVTPS